MSRRYPDYLQVYTDGSKSEENNIIYVGAAFIVPSMSISIGCRLHALHTSTGAELIAIRRALEWISENIQPKNVVICTDSTAALLSFTAKRPEYLSLVSNCLSLLQLLRDRGFVIHFQWVPSHCGIAGNESADKAAKAASKLPNINNSIKPYLNDHNALLKKQFECYLKNKWKEEGHEKFLSKHKVDWESWPWAENKNRKIEVAMARLRIGHSRLRAHLHRLKMIDEPNCIHCQVPETIKHFLLYCHRPNSARCVLRQNLLVLGITNVTVSILLGGGNFDKGIKEKISNILIKFLLNTGKYKDI